MKIATSFLPKSYLYFQSLLKRVNLTKTELCTLRLKNLNQRLDHIEVHEKIFLMKKRRQLKNIGSAQKTRQKAMSNINLLKSRVEILEDQLAAVKETQKTIQERNQVCILRFDIKDTTYFIIFHS